ncbi:Plasmodium exported protein (Pm-fam-a like), unknown function [Plasmodium malariae]|uniref:Fam-l protein n=1 Tax=Plasmodium malariae TaxID=5858 RepID=A0A1A8X4D9_PLAMA|nr:Plasmodium exported protein (Pm-fam-a like), unknown function [Plasmodium malariae]
MRSYRILERYEQVKDSYYVASNTNIKDNEIQEEKYFCNNEKSTLVKRRQLNGSLSKNDRCYKKGIKCNSNVFETKKYSHIEKKIFKELDYFDFLKNNRTISNKTYKKIIRKKLALRISVPLILLLLLSISLILDFSGSYGLRKGLFKMLNVTSPGWHKKLFEFLDKTAVGDFFKYAIKRGTKMILKGGNSVKARVIYIDYTLKFTEFLIYTIPFFILGVTVILGVVYYHKKVKKYDKIKFRKR